MKKLLKVIVIVGNVLFILWVVYNAIDTGFKATVIEIASGLGLVILLGLNIYFLLSKKN